MPPSNMWNFGYINEHWIMNHKLEWYSTAYHNQYKYFYCDSNVWIERKQKTKEYEIIDQKFNDHVRNMKTVFKPLLHILDWGGTSMEREGLSYPSVVVAERETLYHLSSLIERVMFSWWLYFLQVMLLSREEQVTE